MLAYPLHGGSNGHAGVRAPQGSPGEGTYRDMAGETLHRGAERALLEDFSLEMTGKDVPGLEEAAGSIPAGTRVNVTFLGNEDLPMRVAAAGAAKRLGFVPVPHISARRLGSRAELEEFLDLKLKNYSSGLLFF